MWIRQQTQETLETWLRHSPSMKLASGADGEIFWANEAFLEWSKYTLSELTQIGWKKLSVDDESLRADMVAMRELLDGYTQVYTCQKQYIPKNDKPQWGNLTVMRYPASGETQCFLCTFEPLKNGTAVAFALAVDHIKECQTQVSELTMLVNSLTKRDQDEDWIVATIRIMKRYPKVALMCLVVMLSVLGLNNVLQLLQRLHLLGVPIPAAAETMTSEIDDVTEPAPRIIAARWESRDEVANDSEIAAGQVQ